MNRTKAALLFDPNRRPEQLDYVTARTEILHATGDQVWVAITAAQAESFAAQGIVVQLFPEANLIETPATLFDPLAGEPVPPANLTAPPPTGDATAYYLVQLIAQPDSLWLDEIQELGGVYIQDNPIHAAIFRLTAALVTAVRPLPFVRWAGIYHPAYALSYELMGREEPLVATELATLQVDPSQITPSDTGTLQVSFFDDLTTAEMRPLLEAAGATVQTDTGYSLIIDIAANQVMDLLRIPGVRAVERYMPAALGNRRGGTIIGVSQVRNFGNTNFLVNVDGTGEIVGVIDSGLDAAHPDLAGRVPLLGNINGVAQPTVDQAPHGTHVTGTIAGNGTQSAGQLRGMAPAAQVVFHSANLPTIANPTAMNFNNFLAGLITAHQRGARIHSNSWGSFGVTNNTYVAAVSGVLDRFAFLNPESLVIFLAHNFERDTNNNGILDMRSLATQGVAKNILCVGASENVTNTDGVAATYRALLGQYANAAFNATGGAPPVAGNLPISDNADNLALFSNRGQVTGGGLPAALRRTKPDLVAPGTNITSIGPRALLPRVPVGASAPAVSVSAADYYIDSGTSMATPHAAGAAVLVRQFYRQQFGQLRRPLLLEQVNRLVDRPASAFHATGSVMAWVRRDAAAGQNHLVAARYDRTLARQGNIVQLQANVGDHPTPMLARRNDNTYLLHRGNGNALRLSCYDAALAPVNSFGTNGVVTLAPASRAEDDRLPALCVQGDDVAVVWHETGGDNLVMQRFAADTGAARENTPVTLGAASQTSVHPFVIHNGTRYAVVWVNQTLGEQHIQLRFVTNNGNLVGAQPISLFQQTATLRASHLAWDAFFEHFLVVWVDSRGQADGAVYSLRVEANGNPLGAPVEVFTVPAGRTIRRPQISRHPTDGYVLLWEDNTQPGESDADPNVPVPRFDLYLARLNNRGEGNNRIPGNRLRISDAAKDTAGFGALVDDRHITPVWQSDDEINSAQLGVYAVQITLTGRFQTQVDPNTPLIDSGNYQRQTLLEHGSTDQNGVALAWAGADTFLLRNATTASPITIDLQLVRTNADGLPDAGFGVNGVRRVDSDIGYNRLCLHWADTRLIAAGSMGFFIKVLLFDLTRNADAENTFGVNGLRTIDETNTPTVSTQVAHFGGGNNLRIPVVWGRFGQPNHTLRYAVLDRRGNFVVAARDLVTGVAGTAVHGWFHFIESDAPRRSIAAWHSTDAGNMAIFTNRFLEGGGTHNGRPRIRITTLAGDAQNAVIAPRPVFFAPAGTGESAAAINQSRQREYGVAWQHRPAAAAPWEIRFSRLTRNGTLGATRDVQVVADATHHLTDPQLLWHSDGYALAWLSQPLAGGKHTLFFTVLGENGARVDLNFGVAPVAAAPLHQVSAADADVRDFALAWNGRTCRLTWTETHQDFIVIFDGTLFRRQETEPKLRHMQTALAVPRKPGPAGYDRSYEHPSAALVRATLINGATNLRRTALPNFGNDPNDGYGWGRVNLRQALAPLPPVTFYARDDTAVASGQTVRYRFRLPADTRLLRVTLAWTDPPGVRLVNNLNLRLTAPDGRIFVGNRWQAGGPPAAQFSDLLPTPPPANPFEGVHNTEQIVIPGAPTLPPGDYIVEVQGGAFRNNAFQTFPGQPFALVFVGSGNEARFGGLPAAGAIPVY